MLVLLIKSGPHDNRSWKTLMSKSKDALFLLDILTIYLSLQVKSNWQNDF
jgi:hypothetical protein